MSSEYKTLRELDVKPGDVVESRSMARYKVTVVDNDYCALDGDDGWSLDNAAMWRIVSRAPRDDQDHDGITWASDAPKMWRDMTPEEKGAFWTRVYHGGVVEWYDPDDLEWKEDDSFEPDYFDKAAYRTRPEPKRETVTVFGEVGYWVKAMLPGATRSLTLPLIDGTLPAGTYNSAEGHEIIVEKIND